MKALGWVNPAQNFEKLPSPKPIKLQCTSDRKIEMRYSDGFAQTSSCSAMIKIE